MQSETESISQRLRKARIASGLTLKQLASQIAYAESTLSAVENGLNAPSARLLDAIVEGLGIELKWLIDGVGNMLIDRSDPRQNPAIARLWSAFRELQWAENQLSKAILAAQSVLHGSPNLSPPNVKARLTKDGAPIHASRHPMAVPTDQEALADFRRALKRSLDRPGAKARLARELGVSRQAVSQWVTGTNNPDAGKLLRLLAWVRANEAQQEDGSANARTSAPPKTQPEIHDEEETESGPGQA